VIEEVGAAGRGDGSATCPLSYEVEEHRRRRRTVTDPERRSDHGSTTRVALAGSELHGATPAATSVRTSAHRKDPPSFGMGRTPILSAGRSPAREVEIGIATLSERFPGRRYWPWSIRNELRPTATVHS